MAHNTTFMGLTAWDLDSDPYNHSQLSANFDAIDAHDHTSTKGKQIPAGGLATDSITTSKILDANVTTGKLADNSVTTAKLAANSVTSAKIADGTIVGADLADGTITTAKLDASIFPIGHIFAWYRVDPSVAIPSGCEVCDGRAWNTITNKMGPGLTQWNTGNIPDLRNRFLLGAATTGTGSGTGTPPAIGQTGGSHTINLAHAHAVTAHSHIVNSHTHPIAAQEPHKHLFKTTVWDGGGNPVGTTTVEAHTRGTAVPSAAGTRQSFYVPDLNRNEYYGDDQVAPMANEVYVDGSGNVLGSQPAHNHGGSTGGATATTSSNATTTDSQLSATQDIRPGYYGVLYLMRVI